MRAGAIAMVAWLVAACGDRDGAPPVDAADDGPASPCPLLDEAACLDRSDCHAAYELFPCRNLLGYCPEYRRCEAGPADCLGPATCERVEPFCAGPYVISHVGACYEGCARADQCAGCREDKLAFTRATGCANDGSVEFCIPPVLEHAFALIAPTVTCAVGGGRARCDPDTQLLCTFPTTGPACASPHGALVDEAWAALCAVSQLPDVTAIVPTIFE